MAEHDVPKENSAVAQARGSEGEPAQPKVVSVEIFDQIYRLSGTDPDHIARLASLVDSKMRAVAAHGTTVDSLRVAVLASLNIADELIRLQQRYEALAGNVESSLQEQVGMRLRAESLSGLLDEVLDQRRAG